MMIPVKIRAFEVIPRDADSAAAFHRSSCTFRSPFFDLGPVISSPDDDDDDDSNDDDDNDNDDIFT